MQPLNRLEKYKKKKPKHKHPLLLYWRKKNKHSTNLGLLISAHAHKMYFMCLKWMVPSVC